MVWESLTLEEKNHQLFLQQRKILDTIWEIQRDLKRAA